MPLKPSDSQLEFIKRMKKKNLCPEYLLALLKKMNCLFRKHSKI